MEIERAHRVGKFMSDKPRPVIAKFLRFTDKQNILRNSRKLKGTNVFINEDLCEASMVKRRDLLPQLKQARGQGKIAYFSHARLVIQDPLPSSNLVSASARSSVPPLSGGNTEHLSGSNSSPPPLHSFPNLPRSQSRRSQAQ